MTTRAQIIEAANRFPGSQRHLYAIAWVESGGEWHRPPFEVLALRGGAGEWGPCQILPPYLVDSLEAWVRWSGFRSPTPGLYGFVEQFAAVEWYKRRYAHSGESEWRLHHYGPSGHAIHPNVDEEREYFGRYMDGWREAETIWGGE